MEHRPELFDRMVADYLSGRQVRGLRAPSSGTKPDAAVEAGGD